MLMFYKSNTLLIELEANHQNFFISKSFCVVWINLNFHILSCSHSVVGIHYIFIANLLSLFAFFSYWFVCICSILKAFLLHAISGKVILLLLPQDTFYVSNDGGTSFTFISFIISTVFWHLAVESIHNWISWCYSANF